MFFEDRTEAGKSLLSEIQKLSLKDSIVVALPRGGVIVGKEISQGLQIPLDILLVRKLGAPFNAELAVGAIVEGQPPFVYLNETLIKVLKVSDEYLENEKKMQSQVLVRQNSTYRGSRVRVSLAGKSVILVDDGVATGSTIHAAILALKSQKPSQLIVAVPVAPPDAVSEMAKQVKDVICLSSPPDFQAVGQFFRNFAEVSDEEVIRVLGKN